MSSSRNRIGPAALLAVLAMLAWAGVAAGGKWSTGGDVGRSGHQALGRGLPPYEPMWSLPLPDARRIATPLLITNGGPGPRAPRLVFGTDDGTVHLFNLYTGERIAEVRLSNSNVPYSFSGFGGYVGLTDSSTEESGLARSSSSTTTPTRRRRSSPTRWPSTRTTSRSRRSTRRAAGWSSTSRSRELPTSACPARPC